MNTEIPFREADASDLSVLAALWADDWPGASEKPPFNSAQQTAADADAQ